MGKPGLLEEGVHGLLHWKLPTTEAHKIFFGALELFYGVLRVLGRKIPPKMFLISRFLRTGFGHASDFHGEERSFME